MKPINPTPLLIGFDGTCLNQTLQQHLLKINPAGIVLFKRNIISMVQTRTLIREIRDLLGQVLVAVDHEGGLVNRFPENCPSPPSPMALNRSRDWELLVEACRIQAEVLTYLGINLNFSPVLDLATDHRNPAIGTRAFSNNPDEVTAYGKTCVDAHRKVSVGTAVKHFPGHGRSAADSHYSAGEVTASSSTLWDEDLYPFRELVAYGVPAVMLAHLVYPALDPGTPALFSKKIVTELLREKLGFQGFAISDCVEMSAVSKHFKPYQIVQDGIFAGIDLFISSFSLKKSYDFQVELKQSFDEVSQKMRDENSVLESIQMRLKQFQEAYLEEPETNESLRINPDDVVAMHQRSIEKQKKCSIADDYRNFYLLELSGNEQQGINTGEKWGPVAEQLLKTVKTMRQHKILSDCSLETIEEIVKTANSCHLTVILITANGYRLAGYWPFIEKLKKAHSSVHISLMDERDLCGELDNEWVTWGYNSWTAAALARELMLD